MLRIWDHVESDPDVPVPCPLLTSSSPLGRLRVTMSVCALADGLLLVSILSSPLYDISHSDIRLLELMPISATSLIPVVLFPLLGIMTTAQVNLK